MLQLRDEVIVFRGDETHRGEVLGCEGDLFWLLVTHLNEVQRGHLANVFERQGVKYLNAAEWIHKLEHMVDASGKFSSEAFWHSQNPEPMIKRLYALRLIGIIRSQTL